MTDPGVKPPETSDRTPPSSLLDRVKGQDQAAWERIVGLYTPLVYRWCRRAGLQASDAADVGQEVFRAVARKVADFRRDRPGDSFRAWLYTITRNKIRDHWERREARAVGGSDAQRRLLALPADATPDSDPGAKEEEVRLVYRRALELVRAEFAERTWRAFWQVAVEDRPPDAVAAGLGMTVNAVYLAKSRVLHRLREEFAGLIET